MKIEKAIEILTKWKEECSYDNTEELDEAEKLGIEALKRHQECKDRTRKGMLMPLPGEDE